MITGIIACFIVVMVVIGLLVAGLFIVGLMDDFINYPGEGKYWDD